jgi:hypothetical protein
VTDVYVAESTAILIAGMHRSGTSALTRVINLLGVQLPSNLMAVNEQENPKGYWESIDIAAFNDELLHSVGSGWDDVLPVDFSVLSDENNNDLLKKANFLLDRDFCKSSLFAIKDPRFCRILPFWLDLLRHKGVKTCLIIPFRHPLDVAASLERRDGFSPDKSVYLWLRSYVDVLRHSIGVPTSIVSYKSLMTDWSGTMEKIEHDLGLKWPVDSATALERISEYLDPRLSHLNSSSPLASDRLIGQLANQLYSALLDGGFDLINLAETIHNTLSPLEDSFKPFMRRRVEIPANNIINNHKKYCIQLFYDIGSGFVEVDSVRNKIEISDATQEFTFNLQGLEGVQSLRIDPLNDSAVMFVEEILLMTETGITDLTSIVTSNACVVDKKLYYFETADPQIYFNGLEREKLTQAKTLIVKFNYICVGYYAELLSKSRFLGDESQKFQTFENKLLVIQNKIEKQLDIEPELVSLIEKIREDSVVNSNKSQLREEKMMFLCENALNDIRHFYEYQHKIEIEKLERQFDTIKQVMLCTLDELRTELNVTNKNYKEQCDDLLDKIACRENELEIIRNWYGFSLLEKING